MGDRKLRLQSRKNLVKENDQSQSSSSSRPPPHPHYFRRLNNKKPESPLEKLSRVINSPASPAVSSPVNITGSPLSDTDTPLVDRLARRYFSPLPEGLTRGKGKDGDSSNSTQDLEDIPSKENRG